MWMLPLIKSCCKETAIYSIIPTMKVSDGAGMAVLSLTLMCP